MLVTVWLYLLRRHYQLRASELLLFTSGLNGKVHMKSSRLIILMICLGVVAFITFPNVARAADDGAALYKAKCAACHGADGTGKPAVKAPSLVSPEAKKLTDEELTDAIANGGKNKKATHQFAQKGLTPDQIKALVAEIRNLQK